MKVNVEASEIVKLQLENSRLRRLGGRALEAWTPPGCSQEENDAMEELRAYLDLGQVHRCPKCEGLDYPGVMHTLGCPFQMDDALDAMFAAIDPEVTE